VLALAGTTEAVEAARLLLEGGSLDASADQNADDDWRRRRRAPAPPSSRPLHHRPV